MKKKLRCILMTAVLMFFISLFPLVTKAQLFDEGDPDAPIDGGISVLLIAGVGYGIKKANDSWKKKATKDTNENSN